MLVRNDSAKYEVRQEEDKKVGTQGAPLLMENGWSASSRCNRFKLAQVNGSAVNA